MRHAIKELGGTLVAKSLNKNPSKAATIWRLSLNAGPVFNRVFEHFELQGCNARTVLKLIKDIKKVALKEGGKDLLKSYNVRQALLHCTEKMEGQRMTEAGLLVTILEKVSSFLAKAFFPSFLEEKRNLIFNWGPQRCREGHQKLQKVINEVPTWVQRVNQEQAEKKEK